MDRLTELKAIIHSKRANLYYLEKCRIMVKDGRVVFLSEKSKQINFWNIPIANTTVIILGIGTSITNSAVRMLASAGVLIGFSGDGCTPLFSGTEVEWFTPQSEYRPTEYFQGWMSFWYDDSKRLQVAKEFQKARIKYITWVWNRDRYLHENGIDMKNNRFASVLENFSSQLDNAKDVNKLLQIEATMTKALYKEVSLLTGEENFVRSRGKDSTNKANHFLNHGNYLAYGLAATTLWCLGIPHSFAVMHGKTRRGALVFDVADLIKDALVLPCAFIAAKEELSDEAFRKLCISMFIDHKALDFMFNTVKIASGAKDDSDISV